MNERDKLRKNPGNIRTGGPLWVGEVDSSGASFKRFSEWAWGLRGLMFNLRRYYFILGKKTVGDIIHLWAPPHENNTASYVAYAAKRVAYPSDAVIPEAHFDSAAFLYPLAAAISVKEVGWDPPADALSEAGRLLRDHPDEPRWQMWKKQGPKDKLIFNP